MQPNNQFSKLSWLGINVSKTNNPQKINFKHTDDLESQRQLKVLRQALYGDIPCKKKRAPNYDHIFIKTHDDNVSRMRNKINPRKINVRHAYDADEFTQSKLGRHTNFKISSNQTLLNAQKTWILLN